MKRVRVRKTLLYSSYHTYQEVWAAAVGKELVCERETDNYDLYAVVVKRMGNIGHLLRKLSKLCSLFLRRGGAMVCLVWGGGGGGGRRK